MPLYEYSCPQCGRFELIRKFSDRPLKACPTCGKAVQKLPSAPAIQFKGTGWYITDYSRKSPGGDAGGDAGSKGEGSKGEGSTGASSTASKASDAAPSGSSSKETTASKAPATAATKSSEKK